MLTIFDLIENKTESWIKEQREDNQSAIGNIIKYIEKVLMIETKGKPYYTPEFQQKEQFVKNTYKKHNPDFEYLCFVDEGENDFSNN